MPALPAGIIRVIQMNPHCVVFITFDMDIINVMLSA